MARTFRWLFRGLVALMLSGLAVSALLFWFASRSIPDYSMTLNVGGLGAPVEIVRDSASVPHIFGENDPDTFFALGFVHAQDRLWQMMLLRRAAQGRLSELFGDRTLLADDLLRRLDLYPLAVESVAALDDETRTLLAAYSRGVNAWLAEVNLGARGRGAPEYWIFPPQIAPWQPADSVAIAKLMAFRLSDQARNEVLRARLSLVLNNADRLSDIMPDAPGPGAAALPEFASLAPGAQREAAMGESLLQSAMLYPAPRPGMGGASNAWAAAPSRSTSEATLLANDPHLGFSAPVIWYLARMELETGGVIGATIPGIPAIVVGRSDRLAWALTSTHLDDQDLMLEELNPSDRSQVMTPEGWKPLRTRQSIIQVNGAPPRTITLRWSENGPVLPGVHMDLASITPPGGNHAFSLAWTGLSAEDTSLGAVIGIMRAQTIDDALAAGELHVAPAQNLMVVDRNNIAMKVIGKVPRRAARHQSRGRLPAPGARPENRWQGELDYTSNPEFIDPSGGILGNSNNKIIDAPFPFHLSYDWGDTQRVERWRRLLQGREVHTRDSFIEAQLDTVSFTARALLPLIGKDLFFTGDMAPEGTQAHLRQRALALLADWNGEMNEHLPEPLIYAAWLRALQHRLVLDELGGALAGEISHVEPVFIERVFRDVGGASVWCDVVQSTEKETCTEIARLALDDALIWIGSRYGTTLESLRWGDAHEARQDHEVLGEFPLLHWIVNIRQSTSGGDNTLLRGLTSGKDPDPFTNVHGAGYRGVYDLADPDSSVFIISTGQSGHPLSRHYDDLGELWRRGEYIPMSLDPELARAAATGLTILLPQ